jgi:hypothetical protein
MRKAAVVATLARVAYRVLIVDVNRTFLDAARVLLERQRRRPLLQAGDRWFEPGTAHHPSRVDPPESRSQEEAVHKSVRLRGWFHW